MDNGLCSPAGAPGLGIRPGARAADGSGPPPARWPARRAATPYSSTPARVILSMPGAPLFRRTAAHARHKTSLRRTLSYSAWNLRPGSALAARYSACCKARTGSAGTPRPDPDAAGLALTALTGPLQTTLRTDEAAALPSPRVVLSRRSNRYYGRLRRPPDQRSTSRFRPVIGRHAPAAPIRRLPGRGGPPQFPPPPSIRSAPPTPGSSSRLRFQALHRFHGLHPDYGGSALPCPARNRREWLRR